MRVLRELSLSIIFLLCASFAYAQEPYTFTEIDYNNGATPTTVWDMSGNNLWGS